MTWSEQAARSIVAAFDGAFEAPGVVVAVAAIDEAGISCHCGPGDSPADGRFEIGSVTKTLTATLLALAVGEGILSLDDEIGRWLAAGANGGITLRQLATHTSGLPRLAPGHDASRRADPANPYAAYTEETATEGLRQVVVAPGGAHLYSNFGYQLLGLVLERAAGQPYGTLITQRLLSPLSMTCSGVGRDGGGIPLPGHARGREVPRWGHPLPGPGGLEATIGDLARYAQACLHPPQTPLGAAITLAQQPLLRIDDHREQALGWVVRDGNLRWHNGGTGGFASSVMTDPAQGRAVAVLASVSGATASAALDQAAFLALAGGDPRQARPQLPGVEWELRAREVITALTDGRAAEVHARATPALAARVTAEQMERAWHRQLVDAAPVGDVSVDCRARLGKVVAEATIDGAKRPVRLVIVFTPSGEIGGMKFLQLDEEPPW